MPLFLLVCGIFLCFICGLVTLLRLSLLIVTVVGPSMSPGLEHGERVLVLCRWLCGRLHQGDIVVVRAAKGRQASPTKSPDWYVKRIAALGGEIFALPADDPLPAEELAQATFVSPSGQRAWFVPPEHIFVCGDNRAASIDSRSWGPVPLQRVVGVVLFKLSQASPKHTTYTLTPETALVGKAAPPFSAETLDGATITLEQYKHTSLLLFFVANTSISAEHIPEFLSLAEKLVTRSIAIVFICAEERNHVEALSKLFPIPYPVLIAPRERNPLLKEYQALIVPAFCLIDARGIVQLAGFPDHLSRAWQELQDMAASSEQMQAKR